MSKLQLQSAFLPLSWRVLLAALLCYVSACTVSTPTETLLYEAPVGPAGAHVVLSDAGVLDTGYSWATLEIPPNTFLAPVTIQIYRVRPWNIRSARAIGDGLKIVAVGAAEVSPQDVMTLTVQLPSGAQSTDRNIMAVEWDSGEKFYTGGWTLRSPTGDMAALKIEIRKLGSFFPVIYPLGPAMPEPLVSPVDILLVMDNSSSMEVYQSLLFQHDGNLTRQDASLPAVIMSNTFAKKCNKATGMNRYDLWNVHAAVVSTDLGVMPSPTPGGNWPASLPSEFLSGSCGVSATHNWNGDNGALESKTCDQRSISDTSICPATCGDAKVIIERDLSYVRKWSEVDGSGKLVVYPTIDRPRLAETALHCRAILGQKGCGIEMPFASAIKAIQRETAKTTGFLRDPDTSLLVIVIVTNEDDCSIMPSRLGDTYPAHVAYQTNESGLRENCSMLSAPECFNMAYRCFALDNECAESLDTVGPKKNCKVKAINTNPYLTPVESLVKEIVEYKDAAGNTKYRTVGFVSIAPHSKNFDASYLNNRNGMMVAKTPYLSIKENIITAGGKKFPTVPQLRYTKLNQLKSDPDPKNRFSNAKVAASVDFVITQEIDQLIDPMTGTMNTNILADLGKKVQSEIAKHTVVNSAGMVSGYEDCK